MAAFSLATSSTPSDVLQHFLKIRLRAIQWHLEQAEDIRAHAIKAMHLLLTTLRNSQAIFPKRLADTLVRLKDLPLIKQADVQSVTELQLVIHSHWLADELKKYTPWPRHDELQKLEADRIVRSWAKSAQKAFVAGLKHALENVTDFENILTIRQQLFEAWPWTDNRLPGLHSADVIDELREAFNDRLTTIIEMQVAGLRLVCKSARELISSLSASPAASTTLWGASLTELDVGAGGLQYKTAVLTSYNGIDASTSPPIKAFDNMIISIKRIQADLKQMREVHWDDELGGDDDELDSRQTLLSEDDPRTLGECLNRVLKTEADSLFTDFGVLVQQVCTSPDKAANAVALVRIFRELSKRSASQDKLLADIALPLTTSRGVVKPLHSNVAAAVSVLPGALVEKSLARLMKSPVVIGKALWEGKPPLPVQPSAMTFKFLKSVTTEMARLGADLWSEAAVGAFKKVLVEDLAKLAMEVVEQCSTARWSPPTTNGITAHAEEERDDSEETHHEDGAPSNGDVGHSSTALLTKKELARDKLTQLIMDLNYLGVALSTRAQDQIQLHQVVERAAMQAVVGDAEQARLRKSAADYWKRTYLLFALLTPD
jgi:hypothetical protein